jgi:hypothetical protein
MHQYLLWLSTSAILETTFPAILLSFIHPNRLSVSHAQHTFIAIATKVHKVISKLYAFNNLITSIHSSFNLNEIIIPCTCIIKQPNFFLSHNYFHYFVSLTDISCSPSLCDYFNLQLFCCNI